MNPPTPDWLTRRGGSLKLGSDSKTWFVLFQDRPHYSLRDTPAQGKFGCDIRQTENGRQFESKAVYDSRESAIRGGLDDLGRELGWL